MIVWGFFVIFFEIFVCAGKISAEQIVTHSESSPNKVSRILSQRSNFDSFCHDHPNARLASGEEEQILLLTK
jgi:hypothetical protein